MLYQTERLSLKVLQTDKAALRRLARSEGEPMSVIVRRILREEFKRRGLWSPTDTNEQAQTEQIQEK